MGVDINGVHGEIIRVKGTGDHVQGGAHLKG